MMNRIVFIILNVLVTFSTGCWRAFVDECGYSEIPVLVHSLPEGRPVYGVQPIGQEIYVIRDSTPYIEVYDRNTFQPTRNITIDNLRGPYDMVQSDKIPASLFIADWFDSDNLTVLNVPTETESKWSFQENGYTTLGLASSGVYTDANIIVTSAVSQKLKEFSPAGNLVQEVTIQNISRPRQSIQVSPHRYAVCHGYGPPPELHRVCLVDDNGETIKCYGGTRGSGVGQLNIPARLERNDMDCIFVADTGNKRVVLLKKNLQYVKDLISTGLDGPYRLYLDDSNNLLYVADNTVDASGIAVSGRVLIFKLL